MKRDRIVIPKDLRRLLEAYAEKNDEHIGDFVQNILWQYVFTHELKEGDLYVRHDDEAERSAGKVRISDTR